MEPMGIVLGSDEVIPKRNCHGAYGYSTCPKVAIHHYQELWEAPLGLLLPGLGFRV